MGYREYAKDYEIEYVDRPGKKRPKAVRIYVGPYFCFAALPERVRWLKRFYLTGTVLLALLMIFPMCLNCPFTRAWYIQVPAALAWVPWVYTAAATWRLCTAGDKVDREHHDMMGKRMSGATLFVYLFMTLSVVGCIVMAVRQGVSSLADGAVFACCLGSAVCAGLMFSRRKELDMIQVENPEKPHHKTK